MFKNNDAPISLFSFQDVITSLLGIMLFFLLILAINMLELIQSYEQASPRQDEIKAKREANRILQKQLESASADVKRYRQILKSSKPVDKAALTIRRFDLDKQLKKAEAQKSARTADKKIADDAEKLEQQRRQHLIPEKQRVEQKKSELAQQQIRHQQQQKQLKKLKDAVAERRNKINITISGTSGKHPVLIECTGRRIVIFDKLSRLRKNFVCHAPVVSGMIRELFAELKKLDATRYYFIFLIKPDAAKYQKFMMTRFQLEFPKVEYGIEPLLAEEEVIDEQ